MNQNAIPEPQRSLGDAAVPIVIFDFDGTLYSADSFAAFLRWRLLSSPWRAVLACLFLPLILILRCLPDGRQRYASSFLWLASLGLGLNQLHELMAVYVYRHALSTHGSFYPAALAALRQHQQMGHRVVIATGAAEALVRLLLQSQRISDVELVGSRLRQAWAGVVCEYHCYGEKKRAALLQYLPEARYNTAYSDSIADLPVLSHADQVVLVNWNAKHLARWHAWQRVVKQGGVVVKQVEWS